MSFHLDFVHFSDQLTQARRPFEDFRIFKIKLQAADFRFTNNKPYKIFLEHFKIIQKYFQISVSI